MKDPYPGTGMKPRVSLIVALAKNRAIGIDNRLPWHLPADLKRFRALTMGHHIVMGRRTYESIGKPLPGRISVVVTRNRDLQIAGCIVVHTLQQAIAACGDDEEIFVVGGAELYAQALAIADRLYVTEIQQDVQGDAYFPVIDRADWQEISREQHIQQEAPYLKFHYATYQRKPR